MARTNIFFFLFLILKCKPWYFFFERKIIKDFQFSQYRSFFPLWHQRHRITFGNIPINWILYFYIEFTFLFLNYLSFIIKKSKFSRFTTPVNFKIHLTCECFKSWKLFFNRFKLGKLLMYLCNVWVRACSVTVVSMYNILL